MSGRKPRWRLRSYLTLTVLSAVGAGAFSLINLGWTAFAHYDGQRHELSRALWEKRQAAYAELVEITARAAAAERSTEDYAELHQRFYVVYGQLEIYRTHEMGDCVTTLRDTLYACATPDTPQQHRQTCDPRLLHLLIFRLSNDARKSLVRTWGQSPDEFIDDRFAGESCGLESAKRPNAGQAAG